MSPRVGVLALQGDTREHLEALRDAGAEALTVRRVGELDSVDALVIPGGESTTMSHLLREFELLEPLRARLADGMPAYGSCAGMILLATEILDAGVPGREAIPLKAIDMTVRRNAFGRQVDSFEDDIDVRRARRRGARGVHPGAVGGAGRARRGGAGARRRPCRGGPAGRGSWRPRSIPEMTGDRRVHALFVDIVTGRA